MTYRQIGGERPGAGGEAGRARRAGRRPGRGGLAELRPAADVVLRRQRLGPGAGAGELPAQPPPRSSTSSGTPAPTWSTPTRCSRTRWTALDVRHRFVLGEDDDLYLRDTEPRPWDEPDEGATATINYTSGTTARPKGVQLTHRNLWLNATVFGLHAGISDRDVYLHTLPMFHANGWGMPFGITGVGGRHVVLRQVDGTEILRRVERARRHAHVRRAGRRQRGARGRGDLGRRGPRPRPGPHHRGRRSAADPHDRAGARGARLGVHPDLRPHRDLAPADRQPRCAPSGTTSTPTSWPGGSAGRARPRSACASRSTRRARCSPRPTTTSTATGSSPRRPPG